MEDTPKQSPRSEKDNKYVKMGLKVIKSAWDPKQEKDTKNRAIQELFKEGFEASAPTGMKKITSQVLQQAFWRSMNKLKPLDFGMHGTNADQDLEAIVTTGVTTVLKRGGYDTCLQDKAGVFFNLLMYGDGFFYIGANPDDDTDAPLIFNPIPNSNVYVDPYCTSIRAGGLGRSATEMVVVFSTSQANAGKMYPMIKEKNVKGKIPRDVVTIEETGRNFEQTKELDDLVEIAYYYNIVDDIYLIFAGQSCTVIEKHEGSSYPFKMKGRSYIPIVQFKCMPALEGFWNHGIGDILYRLAIVTRQMLNMAVGHAEDSIYPITMVNVPNGEADKFFQKLQMANEMRSTGQKAFVAMEYGVNQQNQAQASALLSPSILNEWNVLFEALSRECRRLGLNLDDIGGNNKTATQVIQETKATDAWIEQMMQYNHKETEFALEVTLDLMKKLIPKTNKSPIDQTVKVKIQGAEIPAKGITLGMIADELKKFNYFPVVDPRSGAIQTNFLRLLELQNVLPLLQPGTPEFQKVSRELARLNNIEFDEQSPEQVGAPNAPQGPEAMGQPPTQPQGIPQGQPPIPLQ